MSGEAPAGRPMKYPYTYTAKLVQFPYKFYWKNSWLFKYWVIASIVTLPLYYKLTKLSNSPGNVEVWREKRKQMFSGGHEH